MYFVIGREITRIGLTDRRGDFPPEPGLVGCTLLGGSSQQVVDTAIRIGGIACLHASLHEPGRFLGQRDSDCHAESIRQGIRGRNPQNSMPWRVLLTISP